MEIVMWSLAALGLLVTGLNFYLSFVRTPLHRFRHNGVTPRFVSGLPIIGSLLLWIAAALCYKGGASFAAGALAIMSLFDTGGLHWFATTMLWRKGAGK